MDRIDGWELGDFMQRSLLGSTENLQANKAQRLKHKKLVM